MAEYLFISTLGWCVEERKRENGESKNNGSRDKYVKIHCDRQNFSNPTSTSHPADISVLRLFVCFCRCRPGGLMICVFYVVYIIPVLTTQKLNFFYLVV